MPRNGSMIYWRYKAKAPCPWRFGYVSEAPNRDFIKLGSWNGDTDLYAVTVDPTEIEWKPYQS